MQTKTFVSAALWVALLGLASSASGQYGPSAPYGVSYPGMGGMQMGMMGANPYAQAMYAPPSMPTQAGPACGASIGCSDPVGGCGGCGSCGDCCGDTACWCHRFNVFGEFLYLRARNAEVAYAVPIDGDLIVGPDSDQVQVGPVELVDPDFQPGFRVGFGFTLSECSAIVATYTQLDADTSDVVSLAGTGPVLRSLVSHPNPLNVAADGLDAQAFQNIQFKLVDVDYKRVLACCKNYELAAVIGARYANLDQNFDAQFEVLGVETVFSEINFDGAGLRLGLDGIVYGCNNQFFGYAKGAASFVGGEFRADYEFNSAQDPAVTDTAWRAGRLVTILDLEIGLGWRNHCDNVRVSGGYMVSCWHNVVKTNEWINSVQQNNFVDQSDNYDGLITFDGLTARVEVLW